jgi:hypothetical protein
MVTGRSVTGSLKWVSVLAYLGLCLVIWAFVDVDNRPAYGHKPEVDPGVHSRWEDAMVLEDTSVSRVYYREITSDSPTFWLFFNAEAGQRIFLQLGVPVVERLREFTPSIAVVGPGGPTTDVPFDLPPGTGAWIYDGQPAKESPVFHEPITDTRSWVLVETTHPIVQDGGHYLVAYASTGIPDKLWVATGTLEAFGVSDFLKLPGWIVQVRRFHEVGPMPRWSIWVATGLGSLLVFVLGRRALRKRRWSI